jgi:hypothetical protein
MLTLRVGRVGFPRVAKSEYLCKASLVRITYRRVTIGLYPFWVLNPQCDPDELPQFRIAADFVGHCDGQRFNAGVECGRISFHARGVLSSGALRGYYQNYSFLQRSIGVLVNHPKERSARGLLLINSKRRWTGGPFVQGDRTENEILGGNFGTDKD